MARDKRIPRLPNPDTAEPDHDEMVLVMNTSIEQMRELNREGRVRLIALLGTFFEIETDVVERWKRAGV